MNRNAMIALVTLLTSPLLAADLETVEVTASNTRCTIVGPVPQLMTALVDGLLADRAAGSARDQTAICLSRFLTILTGQQASLQSIARLNVYIASDDIRDEVDAVLKETFPGPIKPAVTYVTTKLPRKEALVGMDLVAALPGMPAKGPRVITSEVQGARVASAILPPGPRVYISGQAEKGDGTLADATTKTMESLGRTIEWLGLTKSQVVHVKSFVTPMSDWEIAQARIDAFFGDSPKPPSVFVEWQSTLPIEIELVVSAADVESLGKGPKLEIRTPPGMTASPVYSRLTIVRHPKTIYLSSIYSADATATKEYQVRSVFSNTKRALDAVGTDWLHLAKATYYVSDDQASTWHNSLRPDFYSPRRPPAASKAKVSGVGLKGHCLTMDFIAVLGVE